MKENVMGELLDTLRYKGNMTRIELCEGVCSTATLLRIEEGVCKPDKLVVEALFERLGITQDKLENTILKRDYYLQELRHQINSCLARSEYDETRKKLEEYKEHKEAKEILHMQYLYRIEAILIRRVHKNHKKYTDYLKKAVALTFSGDIDNINAKRLLTEAEITLLLMITKENTKKDPEEMLRQFRNLQIYVQSNYEDPKTKARIYPKVYYMLAIALKENNKYLDMMEICEKGMQLLEQDGILTGMDCLLSLFLEGKKASGLQNIGQTQNKNLKVLLNLYQEYNICNKHAIIWERVIDEEVFLINELIRRNRRLQKVSQESLGEGIECEGRAICEMERSAKGPNRPHYLRIRKILNINQNYFRGFIFSYKIEEHMMQREISRLISVMDYEEAEKLFTQLREKLSKDKKENAQYILWMDTLLKVKQKKIQTQEALDNYYEALYITLPQFNETNISNYILARKEVFILNEIAVSKSLLGEKNKAIEMLTAMLVSFKDSEVHMRYYMDGMKETMLYLALERKDGEDLRGVNTLCDDAIRFLMQGGKGRYIGRFLAVKGYVSEMLFQREWKPDYRRKAFDYFRAAYRMCIITQEYAAAEAIDLYCKKWKRWKKPKF